MKCSWKWLQWWGTCEMYMCRWDLEICLCFQKDLEIHLYPKEESKDNAKTRFGQHNQTHWLLPLLFFSRTGIRLVSSHFPKPASVMEQQESWVAAGQTRIGTLPTAAHPIAGKGSDQGQPRAQWQPTKALLKQVQGQARTSCQDQQVRKPRRTGLPTAELSQGPRARTRADRSSWACRHGVPEMNFTFSWVLLFLQPEGFWSLWWLFSGTKKEGIVQYSAVFSSPQTRQLWVSSLNSNVSTSFKCSLIW